MRWITAFFIWILGGRPRDYTHGPHDPEAAEAAPEGASEAAEAASKEDYPE
jgi:hypothetical protein